ncbi:hypothetical protein [Bifidobacterium cuniculi]|uniref:Uncharacterized protein n=1 Tax=Bifidobacterium cuniculi TaxID=1688 RepID=A0A087AHS4_9BIFI|nr:hypothetical protein [Bifidobacterium cuniculi]KFI58324.1 hypothetical protein BCUN_1925 [Bifidobacterium cuniculi]
MTTAEEYERTIQSLAAEAAMQRRRKRYWKTYAKQLEALVAALQSVPDADTMDDDAAT